MKKVALGILQDGHESTCHGLLSSDTSFLVEYAFCDINVYLMSRPFVVGSNHYLRMRPLFERQGLQKVIMSK